MVRVVGGSVLVYVLLSRMASQVGPIQGFDDMQSVVGADLLSRGYFPWSDFLFIHGLFEDALRSSVGFGLFERSLWGTYAALGMVWIPLTWLGVYWIGIWASRGRAAPLLAVTVLLVWGAVHVGPSYRWVAMSVVWLLLGEAVRRGTWPWTALLTAAMFIEAVLVPEASFQVIGATVVLVGSDLVHRGEGVGRWRALVRTRVFVVTGAGCTVLLCGYLATQGALGAFVNYYLVFGPGHAESGALPIPDLASQIFINVFVVSVFFAGLTLWLGGIWWIRGRPLTSRHWVAFGVALTTALYAEKGLARFDDGHLLQVVTVATPLLAIWVALALSAVDDRVRELIRPEPGPSGRRVAEVRARRFSLASVRQPVSIAVVAILLVTLPSVTETARAAPGHNVSVVGGDRVAGIGWASEDAVDRSMLRDLRTVVDLYTKDGPVFDFTNSPGYFYYLLGEDPPTSLLPRQHGSPGVHPGDRDPASWRSRARHWWSSMRPSACPPGTGLTTRCATTRSRSTCWTAGRPCCDERRALHGPQRPGRRCSRPAGAQRRPGAQPPPLRLPRLRLRLQRELPDPRADRASWPLTCRTGACAAPRLRRLGIRPRTGPERQPWVVVAGGVVVASLAATHARVDVAEELDNPGALKSGFSAARHPAQGGGGVVRRLSGRRGAPLPGRAVLRVADPARPDPHPGLARTGHRRGGSAPGGGGRPRQHDHCPRGDRPPDVSAGPVLQQRRRLGRATSSCPTGTRSRPSATGECVRDPAPGRRAPSGCGSARVCSGTATTATGCTCTQRDPANPVDRHVLSGVTRPYEE